ncbi:prepilin peptidase [Yaniella halotolerans]|uniref:prepilin peptidase n=1 Tax=Yaniella halotolerans TaxID=225453 RepID=UPI0003B31F53|nr:A24 family peptidase [Yaniella halotolerans]
MTQLLTEYFSSTVASPLTVMLLSCALLWFLMCSIVLFVIDIREHRLPNRWTGLLFIGGAGLLLATTLTASANSIFADRWLMIVGGSAGYLAAMLILHVLTRAGLGMGDVKLAAGIGLYTGFLGWEAVIAGFVLAFLAGGLQAIYLVLFKGAKKNTRIAFGPAMLVGGLLTLLM